MKKVFMTLAAVLMGVTAMNAQLVIGGSVGLGGQVGTQRSTDGEITSKESNIFNFNLSPKIGYQLLDGKMEVGAAIGLGYRQTVGFGEPSYDMDDNYMSFRYYDPVVTEDGKKALKTAKFTEMSLSVVPYVRYYFLQKGIFSLGLQAQINLGGSFFMAPKYYAVKGVTAYYGYDYEVTADEAKEMNKEGKEELKKMKPSNFNGGLYIKPVMKFDLTDHCYMDIALDAVSLYVAGSVTTYKTENAETEAYDVKNKISNFYGGISGFTGNVVSVGFAYKF